MTVNETKRGSLGEVVEQPSQVPEVGQWQPPRGKAFRVIAWIIIIAFFACVAMMIWLLLWTHV